MKKIAVYLNNPVSFLAERGETMVNATEMAKTFNKQPSDWMRLGTSQTFLASLERVRGIPRSALIQVVKGGNNTQGTWFHEDVALEFARWLSHEFAIWCNDRIKEFAKFGFTADPETLEAMIADPDLVIGLAEQVKGYRRKVAEQAKTIAIQKPKVEFVEGVFEAPDLFTVAEVAKMLGTGQKRLFAKLRDRKVLRSNNEPYQTFEERGYFVSKGTKVGSAAFPKVVRQTYVTTRGIAWIRLNIV